MAGVTASLEIRYDVGHPEPARDERPQMLSKVMSDLFLAAVYDQADQFREAIEQPKTYALLLDPDQGVENLVRNDGETLVHMMAEHSSACLHIFLEFAKENCERTSLKQEVLAFLPRDLWPVIHDYLGRFNYICIAALDKRNAWFEIPFLKAVYDVNIASVKLFLNYPATPVVSILNQGCSRVEEYQSLIERNLSFLEGTGPYATRVRKGIARNPDSDNPLLELKNILGAAIAKASGKIVVGDTPLIDNYFMR